MPANNFFVHTYKSANDVIQSNDKEAGKIIGKGNYSVTHVMSNFRIEHTITLLVKEGRYKYIITPTNIKLNKSALRNDFSPYEEKKSYSINKKFFAKANVKMDELVTLIKITMEKESELQEDW